MFRGLYAHTRYTATKLCLVIKLGEGMFLWRPPCPNPKVLGQASPVLGYIYILQCVPENGQVLFSDHVGETGVLRVYGLPHPELKGPASAPSFLESPYIRSYRLTYNHKNWHGNTSVRVVLTCLSNPKYKGWNPRAHLFCPPLTYAETI